MRKYLVFTLLFFFTIVIFFLIKEKNPTIKKDSININLSIKGNSIRHVASGFLHTPDNNLPAKENLEGLNPRFFRNHPDIAASNAKRMNEMGAVNEIVISDGWEYDKKNLPNNNQEKWSAYVKNILDKTNGDNYQIRYDIWNEPDIPYFWSASWNEFLENWKKTVILMREIRPGSIIVGPSLSKFDSNKLTEFIEFANKNNVLPNVLSWHENDLYSFDPESHVKQIKAYLNNNKINIDEIEINEYGPEEFNIDSFAAIKHFSALEKADITFASKSCWNDYGLLKSGCAPAMIDSLLTTDGEKRSIWWAYKFYSEMKGFLLKNSSTDFTQVISSADADKVYILLSPKENIQNFTVNLGEIENNFSPNLNITIYKVDGHNKKAAKNYQVSRFDKSSKKDLIIPIGSVEKNDMYFIIVGKNI